MTSRISRDPAMMGGAYCIRGTRVPVRIIKNGARHYSHDRILSDWPELTQADIDAALAFRSAKSVLPLSSEGRVANG